MSEQTEADVIARLAAQGMEVQDVNGVPFIVIPGGFDYKTLENLLPAPKRIKGKMDFATLESFTRYVNRFKNDNTTILVSIDGLTIKASLDFHAPDAPSHCDHIALCSLSADHRWTAWLQMNNKSMSQEAFAEFIEDKIEDIVEPDASTILELGRGLKATMKVTFASGKDLSNGATQLVYQEDIKGSTSKGNINIPQEFTIGIPRFTGGELYKVKAKFRYRIRGGELKMSFKLMHIPRIEEDAQAGIVTEIEKATKIKPFIYST